MICSFDRFHRSVPRRCIIVRPRLTAQVAPSSATLVIAVAAALAALTAGATRAQAQAGRTATAQTPVLLPSADSLRQAREGDLHVGDRVILRVPGVPTLTDTFVVRAGRTLELPLIPAIPLAGISRADLQHHLRTELARFVLDTSRVEARSLMRMAVVGDVVAPGYYAVAPDALVGDVLMRAGGLGHTASPDRIVVRRGETEIWSAKDLRKAIVAGRTLDELKLRAGDEIVVPTRRDWAQYAQTAAIVAGAAVSVILIRHR